MRLVSRTKAIRVSAGCFWRSPHYAVNGWLAEHYAPIRSHLGTALN